ncbi:pyridoxamine 5-phosphate oxidase [Candidatus Nitromaritima sp. SCGC AAA799-C22]|nr:pyridoxamine 5-phosphate oxidase [Candidatus Nitromaritima sp. SCGC AAA799-C22]
MKKPGSKGEHILQMEYGATRRASVFYDRQMLDYLNPAMREFISRQEMVFIATSDSHGECDCSFRAGSPGFVRVIDEKILACPEYRGNGVMASLGNILENQHIGMVFIDFFQSTVGLHVNGKARIVQNEEFLELENLDEDLKRDILTSGGRKPERWIFVQVEEAYIHCSKHIPLLKKQDKAIHWGTDKETFKGGDYFKTKDSNRS